MPGRMFSVIPGLHPLDRVAPFSQLRSWKVSSDIARCPLGGTKLPSVRTTGRGKEGDWKQKSVETMQTGDAEDLDQRGTVRLTRKSYLTQILKIRSRQPVWGGGGSGRG